MTHIPASTSRQLTETQRFFLAEKLKNQDHTAIAELYDLYSAAVYGIAFKIVKSPDLAATVLQDTFCKVWKYSTSYDPGKSGLFTWISSIARNTAIDVTRNQHFKSATNIISLENAVYNTVSDNNATDSIGVPDLLKKMNEKHLTLLHKYYFQGYTHSEIVEELGLPLGTIKSRLRNAIQELRVTLLQDLNIYNNTS